VQLNQSASACELPLLLHLFISFVWLSSLVLPQVRRKMKARSYYYVSWCRLCAPPYRDTVIHESKSTGTHGKRFTIRFTGFTQSQTPLLVGYVFPPFHCFFYMFNPFDNNGAEGGESDNLKRCQIDSARSPTSCLR
jgi:hypothetical protein